MTDEEDEIIEAENLYDGSHYTVQSFCYLLKIFGVKHALPEKGMIDLLQIFCTILPTNNKCPSTLYKFKKRTNGFQHKKTHYNLCPNCHSQILGVSCSNEDCVSVGDPMTFYTFDLESQIETIIKGKNFKILNQCFLISNLA